MGLLSSATLAILGLALAPTASIAAAPAHHRTPARYTHLSAARPAVETTAARPVSARVATLRGVVRPNGVTTRYRFVYSTRGRTRTTAPIRVAAYRHAVLVHARLADLQPGHSYDYRVLASNHLGQATGGAQAFTTAPLPTGHQAVSPAPLPTPTPTPTPTVVGPQHPMLWGAEIGTQFTGGKPPWDMSAVTAFANVVGKAPAILPFNIPFVGCDSGPCSWYEFPTQQMDNIRNYGSIPMINWSSMSSPFSLNENGFSLKNVISGMYDDYIRAFATSAEAWGHPFFLRFNWEMNSNWFPWSEQANNNAPGESAAAWRHVHDIFTSVGATNVSWVWCPSVTQANATVDLQEVYPGDSYVDWTCLDGYNWGTKLHGPHGWNSFSQIYTASYNRITSFAPSKPMMIGEVASSADGGSKPAWISDMFDQLQTNFPKIRALLWFDVQDGSADWPLESSADDANAFRAGVGTSAYASNNYATSSVNSIASALGS